MPSFRTATVAEVIVEHLGIQRVRLEWPPGGEHSGDRAYALTEHVGPLAVGDEVVVNTTAVELGLGTGGWHVVHWNLGRREWSTAGGGHVMKVRYTSVQTDAGAAEEHQPAEVDAHAFDLGGLPVVVASVHSQVAAVAAAVADRAPGTRLVYVMTDGGALPAALSDLARAMTDLGWVAITVSAGHAFGGDREAVNVVSALAVARGEGAEVVVVAPGPGVVGTGTATGHTGVEVAAHLDGAAAIGGRPIVAVRASSADPRPRHRGLSHHTETALRLAGRPARIAVPSDDSELVAAVHSAAGSHQVVPIEPPDVAARFADAGLRVTTMGRTPAQDPRFFAAAAAAGALAVR